jgi:2-aminoethylphosphonate-pyruvate transaminase
MKSEDVVINSGLLLIPGPVTVNKSVMTAMSNFSYIQNSSRMTSKIRKRLVSMSTSKLNHHTSVRMEGNSEFAIKSLLGNAIPDNGKWLVISNGRCGDTISKIAGTLKINFIEFKSNEKKQPELSKIEELLINDVSITHVAVAHIEISTGMINPLMIISKIVKKYGKIFIVDATGSFGGIPLDVFNSGIDFLAGTSDLCIQGMPGISFVIASSEEMRKCSRTGRSQSFDLYEQWETMEIFNGKWRNKTPIYTLSAFYQALCDLEKEGGIDARYIRYRENHETLLEGMKNLRFKSFLPENIQSPVVTYFHYPRSDEFNFTKFYKKLLREGFMICQGETGSADTFGIASIGNVKNKDMKRLLKAIARSVFW